MIAELNNQPTPTSFLARIKNTHWSRLLLFFAAGTLFIAWIFRIITPEQLPPQKLIQSNYDQTQTNFSQITYTGEPIIPPASLPSGSGTNELLDSTEVAEKLARHFGLSKVESNNPRVGIQYENTEYRLMFHDESNSFELMSKAEIPTTNLGNVGDVTKIAQDIIDLIYGRGTLTPIQSEIEYLVAEGGLYENSKPTDATVLMIPFGTQLGVFPVYLEQRLFHPALVWVNGNELIQKAFFYIEYLKFETGRSYKTLTYTQALANINQGNASIVTSSYEHAGFPSLSTITKGTLRTGKIEYRLDPQSETLVPYYQFEGSLTNDQGQTVEAIVITPAVQTNFSE